MAAQVQNAIGEAIAFVVSNRDGTEPTFRITPEGMRMVIEQLNEIDFRNSCQHFI